MVTGSNPVGIASISGSIPDTWVTVYSGDMGNPFGPKGFVEWFQSACLIVEISQIIVHEAGQPDSVLDLFGADGLTGKDEAEIDLLAVETDAPACGDGDGLVVEPMLLIARSVPIASCLKARAAAL